MGTRILLSLWLSGVRKYPLGAEGPGQMGDKWGERWKTWDLVGEVRRQVRKIPLPEVGAESSFSAGLQTEPPGPLPSETLPSPSELAEATLVS